MEDTNEMPEVECKMVAGPDWGPRGETQTTINTQTAVSYLPDLGKMPEMNQSDRNGGDGTVTHIDRTGTDAHRENTHTDRGTATSGAKHRPGSKDETKKKKKCRYCTFFLLWANFWAICQTWNKADRRVMG